MPLWNVPYRRNPHFTGREELLGLLDQHLSLEAHDSLVTMRRAALAQPPLVIETQCRAGPKDIPYGVPPEEWSTVLKRVLEKHEFYPKVAKDYGVSRETIRR